MKHTAGDGERVRISTLHSLTYTWLMPRLADFTTRHPGIHLGIDTEIGLSRFDDDVHDIAIRHGAGHWPGLTAHHLMDDALFPVASPAFAERLAIGSAQRIAELPLIHDLARQGWHDWFRHADVAVARIDERFVFSDTTDALEAAACVPFGTHLNSECLLGPGPGKKLHSSIAPGSQLWIIC